MATGAATAASGIHSAREAQLGIFNKPLLASAGNDGYVTARQTFDNELDTNAVHFDGVLARMWNHRSWSVYANADVTWTIGYRRIRITRRWAIH
jgi:hypothetical protein